MSDRTTKQIIDTMDQWEKTASDRDIQYQLLRVAVETREKIESIRGIITFLFVLWIIGFVGVLVVNLATAGGVILCLGSPPHAYLKSQIWTAAEVPLWDALAISRRPLADDVLTVRDRHRPVI